MPAAARSPGSTAVPAVVLASQSPYRKALLSRLLPDFVTAPQHVDESAQPGERPADLALRLARTKAAAAAAAHPEAVVIGSDQVAALSERQLTLQASRSGGSVIGTTPGVGGSPQTPGDTGGGVSTTLLLVIALGVGVLAVGGLLGFMVMRGRKPA